MQFLWQSYRSDIPREEDGGGTSEGKPPSPDPPPAGWETLDAGSEIRGLMETKGYKDYGDVAKAYFHLNKLHNGAPDVIGLPGDNADPKAWDDVFTKLGRPESPDLYDFGLGPDVEQDDDFVANAKKWLHEAGVSRDRAAKFGQDYQKYVTERMANAQEADRRQAEAEVAEIRKKYGQQADAVIARGQNAIKALGLSDELVDKIEHQLGAPAVVELIATLGERIGKEDVKLDGVSSDGMGETESELRAKRASMSADPEIVKALTTPNHPAHQRYKREWDRIVDRLARMEAERDRSGR